MPAKKHKHQNTFWAWLMRILTGPESFSVQWNDQLNTTDPHKNWLSNLEFNLNLYNHQISNSSRYTAANRFEFLEELQSAVALAQSDGNARVAYPIVSSVISRLSKKQVPQASALYTILNLLMKKYQAAGLGKKPVVSLSYSPLAQLTVSSQHVAAELNQQEQLQEMQQEIANLTAGNKQLQADLEEKNEQLKQAQIPKQPSVNVGLSLPAGAQSPQLVSRTVKASLGKKQASFKELKKQSSDFKKENNRLKSENEELTNEVEQLKIEKEKLTSAKFANEQLINQLTTQIKALNNEKSQLSEKFAKEKHELIVKVDSLEKAQHELIALSSQSNETSELTLPKEPQAAAIALMDRANKDRKLAENRLVELQNTHMRYQREMEAKLAVQQQQAQTDIETLTDQKLKEFALYREETAARVKLLDKKISEHETKIQNLSRFIHRLWAWFWVVAKPAAGSENLSAEQQKELQNLNQTLIQQDVQELTLPPQTEVKISELMANSPSSSFYAANSNSSGNSITSRVTSWLNIN